MDSKLCEICNQNFHLTENRSGIVVDEDHFVCETCAKKLHHEDVSLPCSTMSDEKKMMPIALWMIKEENKDKQFMSVKRQ